MPSGIFTRSAKHNKSISESHKRNGIKPPVTWLGKKLSKEHIQKLSQSHLGKTPWNKGTKGVCKAWNKGLKGFMAGDKNPNWQGGKSFEPYGVDWKKSIRIAIRERDKYICQLCGEKQGDVAHSVHHINYDKSDCDPLNLITLCRSCHMKTNNNRDYWTKYFCREVL